MSAVDRLHGARAYRNDNMCPGFVYRHRPDTRSPCDPWSLSRAASPARDLVQKGRRATCPVRPRRQSCSTDLLMHLHTPLHGGLPRQSRNRQVVDSELLCNPNCPATGEVGTPGQSSVADGNVRTGRGGEPHGVDDVHLRRPITRRTRHRGRFVQQLPEPLLLRGVRARRHTRLDGRSGRGGLSQLRRGLRQSRTSVSRASRPSLDPDRHRKTRDPLPPAGTGQRDRLPRRPGRAASRAWPSARRTCSRCTAGCPRSPAWGQRPGVRCSSPSASLNADRRVVRTAS